MTGTQTLVEKRYQFKKKLMNELVRNQRYSRTAVMATLHFIDYLLQLPEEYMKRLSQEIVPVLRKESELMELYNEENAPPTVLESFAERIEIEGEKRRREGLKQGLEQGLEQLALEKKRIAERLLARNIPLEEIVIVTELPLEEVKALKED